MTAPTQATAREAVTMDDLMRLAGRLESFPLTFDVVMVRKQRGELRAAIQGFVDSALAAERAEAVRTRKIANQLLKLCDQAGHYVGNEAPDHEAVDWFDELKSARAGLSPSQQGEPK